MPQIPIFLSYHIHDESTVIPIAYYTETDGSFVNSRGMAQQFSAAIRPPDGVKPGWQTLVELAAAMGKPLSFGKLEDVRKGMAPEVTV